MCSSPPRLLIFDKAASDLKKTQNAALRDGNDTQYLRLFKSSIYWAFICTSMTSLCLFFFFFLFAQIIDNNFTVSTSAVMSIYRRGGKVKGGTRWSFYHRVATVWPTQTAHFATGVDEMEKHCGERERETACTLQKSSCVPLCPCNIQQKGSGWCRWGRSVEIFP